MFYLSQEKIPPTFDFTPSKDPLEDRIRQVLSFSCFELQMLHSPSHLLFLLHRCSYNVVGAAR